MRKVLFILDHLGCGGTQEYVLNYCRKVPGQAITVVSLFGENHYGEALRRAGAEVIFLTAGRYGIASMLRPEVFLGLRRLLQHRLAEFDTVQIRLFAAFLYSSLMRLYRFEKVGVGLDCGSAQLPWYLKAIYTVFARKFKSFWLHPHLREQYPYLRLEDARLRPQFYFVTERQSETPYPYVNRFNLLSVGRCIPQKGHREVLDVFMGLCAETNADVALYIVGDGPELSALRTGVPEKLRPRVFFPGTVRNLDDYLVACDGVIKMGHGEGINSVVREALWLGKPVATTLETASCRHCEREHPGLLLPLERENFRGCVAALQEVLLEAASPGADAATCRRRTLARVLWPDKPVLAHCTY